VEQVEVHVELDAAGYRVAGTARGHTVVLDEPTDLGGADAGPTPLETLLVALGACTAMTVRMYASRKGWALRTVRVTLSHAQLARDACVDCPPDAEFPVAERIVRRIELGGDLDADQRARLTDIANRCPVHRVLTRHPVVITEVAPV
jgi:putative redox protein